MTMTEGRSAEAIVIGGGVVGASVAFHLARLGLRDVVLLERGWLACEATGQSGALVRTHYTNAPEARLALAGLRWFEGWGDMVGGSCGFQQTGFMQICGPDDAARLRENVAMLRDEVGVETRLVDAAEAAAIQPGLRLEPGEVAAYEPRSGYADPLATTRSLAAAAAARGAEVREQVRVTGLRVSGSKVVGVDTSDGPIDAPTVVVACGGWSVELLQPLGVELPIRPVLSQIAMLQRPDGVPRGPGGHLTLIDRARGYYARPDGEELTLVGLSGLSRDLPAFEGAVGAYDFDTPGRARAGIAGRFASYAKARFVRKQSGPLDVTPDRCAIIGRGPAEGLFLAVGMSGSGFKKAPAVGACVAELITAGQATTAPIEPFRLERFAEDDLVKGNDYAPIAGREGVTPH